MPHTWQFVDSIASSPTVRLDINSLTNGIVLTEQPEMSPPQRRRAWASSMMSDGATLPASAFENRVLRIPLFVTRATADLQATLLQSLARELSRESVEPGGPGNIIRVQMGTTNPMFFRTFPAPDAVYDMSMRLPMQGKVTLEIPCEPFGYGLRETLSAATVTNNPAAGTNGMYFDITTVKGDVETPLTIRFTNGTHGLGATGRLRSALSVRRRGTVANTPLVLQAESMTMGTETVVQANNAAFSGSGSNFVKTTPTTTTMLTRLSTTTRFPSTASVDARGSYRVFARIRQNTTADVWDLRLLYGSTNIQIVGDAVRIVAPGTAGNIMYVDLGRVQIPINYDPVVDGLTGTELATEGVFLSLQAQRHSGSGTLDTDLLLFLPSDDRTEYIKWPTTQTFSSDTFVAQGGPSPSVYCLNTNGQLTSTEAIEIAGSGLMITPGRTNRVFFVRDVGTGTASLGTGDSITATNVLTASYFPRYLFPLRPATT